MGKRCWRGGISRKGIKWREAAGVGGKVGAGLQLQAGGLAGCKGAWPWDNSNRPHRCPRGRTDGVRRSRLLVGWTG